MNNSYMPNEKFLYNRRGAEYAEKIFFCRKARKNAQNLKNQNNAFFCALRVLCGKRYFKSFLSVSAPLQLKRCYGWIIHPGSPDNGKLTPLLAAAIMSDHELHSQKPDHTNHTECTLYAYSLWFALPLCQPG
jgi:hypothetical protein